MPHRTSMRRSSGHHAWPRQMPAAIGFATLIGIGLAFAASVAWNTARPKKLPPHLARHLDERQDAASFKSRLEVWLIENDRDPAEDFDPVAVLLTLVRNEGDLLDPWGRPYIFTETEAGYLIESFGRDGERGGTGRDEDFASPWTLF
ncbi:MAG: type II secretion system protein GspG [Phycisphaerales bacterium]